KDARLFCFGRGVNRVLQIRCVASVGAGEAQFPQLHQGMRSFRGCRPGPDLSFERIDAPVKHVRAVSRNPYGSLVIWDQLKPITPAYLANDFSFWIRTARTTLESSARPRFGIRSGITSIFLCA